MLLQLITLFAVIIFTAVGSTELRENDLRTSFFKIYPKPYPNNMFKGCAKNEYPPDEKYKIPHYVVNLDLPPEQRWTQLIKDKSEQLHVLLANIKNLTAEIFHGELFRLIDKYMPYIARTLPYPFYDEILGMAKVTNFTMGDLTLFNLFYEIFTVCTSTIAQDKDGKLYHGRNLDFGLFLGWDVKNHTWLTTEALRPLVVNVDYRRQNKTLFMSIQFAGYVGILTAVKPQQFTLTLNERFQLDGGYIGILKWILGDHKQKWTGFLTRSVLENATSYDEAMGILTKTRLLAPVYFILGGNKTGQASIITRWQNSFDIWKLGTASLSQNSTWYLMQTNYDHWEKPPFFDDRRTPAIICMDSLGQKNGASFMGLYNMLSSKPVLNKLTTYTALMQVNSGYLEAWLRCCPDPCWPW